MASERLYADSSALVKLLVDEPESVGLKRFLRKRRKPLVTSRLAVVEVRRAALVRTTDPAAVARTAELLDGCVLIDVSSLVLDAAAGLVTTALRSLDAIHLASALAAGVDTVVTYDRRQIDVGPALGLDVVSPA